MPDVVSDTSPLQYLHQVGQLQILPALYGCIFVPEAVALELERGLSQGVSLPDLKALSWVRIESVPPMAKCELPSDFGLGERAVFASAMQKTNPIILMDDARAKSYARTLGITCTGTLGVLIKAKEQGHLSKVLPIIQALESSGFFLDSRTREAILEFARETDI